MHQSVYGKHRVIFLSETREGHIALPRGCKQRLFDLLDEVGVRYSYRDERYAGRNISAQFSGILRPEQEHAANQLLKHDNGILSAPTGFGKTVIGAFVIAHLQLSTLVIVPKTALISQWTTRLSEFLDIQHPDGPLLRDQNPSEPLEHGPLVDHRTDICIKPEFVGCLVQRTNSIIFALRPANTIHDRRG